MNSIASEQVLSTLIEELKTAIDKQKSNNNKALVYETIKNFISINHSNSPSPQTINQYIEKLTSMARFNFSNPLEISEDKDAYAFIATGLNMLAEELNCVAVPRHFLKCIDLISDPAVIVDESGKIVVSNQLFRTLYRMKDEQLKDMPIACLLITDILPDKKDIDDEMENIMGYAYISSCAIPIFFDIKVLADKHNPEIAKAYIYVLNLRK